MRPAMLDVVCVVGFMTIGWGFAGALLFQHIEVVHLWIAEVKASNRWKARA